MKTKIMITIFGILSAGYAGFVHADDLGSAGKGVGVGANAPAVQITHIGDLNKKNTGYGENNYKYDINYEILKNRAENERKVNISDAKKDVKKVVKKITNINEKDTKTTSNMNVKTASIPSPSPSSSTSAPTQFCRYDAVFSVAGSSMNKWFSSNHGCLSAEKKAVEWELYEYRKYENEGTNSQPAPEPKH